MSEIIFLAQGTTNDVAAVAYALGWQTIKLENTEGGQWQPPGMNALVTWQQIEPDLGRIHVQGEHAEVAAADLGEVFDLIDSYDAMESVGQAESPGEVVLWARRIGSLAAGDFDPALASVIKGLLSSEREEFVRATMDGLQRARWPGLIEAIAEAVKQWPGLKEQGDQAIASMRAGAPRPLGG